MTSLQIQAMKNWINNHSKVTANFYIQIVNNIHKYWNTWLLIRLFIVICVLMFISGTFSLKLLISYFVTTRLLLFHFNLHTVSVSTKLLHSLELWNKMLTQCSMTNNSMVCWSPVLNINLSCVHTLHENAPFRKNSNSTQRGRFALILWRLVKGSFFCVF